MKKYKLIVLPFVVASFLTNCGAKEYTITWKRDDGSLIKTTKVKEGETPTFDGIPDKPETNDEYFKFSNWDSKFEPATAPKTYTAYFNRYLFRNIEMHVTFPDSATSKKITFNYTGDLSKVDWGDGTTSDETKNEHTYLKAGSYLIKIIPGSRNFTAFLIGDGDKYVNDAIIPSSFTSISRDAFHGCESLKSITIPDSITLIGEKAFLNCYALTSITIPDNVETVEDYAFEWCSSLESLTIPSKMVSIGKWAFESCSSLSSIVVKNGNPKYDSRNNCNAIIETSSNKLILGCKNTIIPNDIITISNDAFRACSNLTSINIPSSVTSIGADAFAFCESLDSISIPSSVTYIGNHAFDGCSKLKFINLPSSVTSIDDYTFLKCSSLESIIIPNTIVSIGKSAFDECKSLKSIAIPSSVTHICDNAFRDCESLKSITIPFIGESKESNTYFGYIFGADSADNQFTYVPMSLETVSIAEGITSISKKAFNGCTSLQSILIPRGVNSIGDNAFFNCESLILADLSMVEEVPDCGANAFDNCNKLVKIKVKKSLLNDYKNASDWKKYADKIVGD